MKKAYIIGIAALAWVIIGLAWADQLTLSTYYPAPYGVYREFTTTSKTCLATNPLGTDGSEDPNAMVGIGTTNPLTKAHIQGNLLTGDIGVGFLVPTATHSNPAGIEIQGADNVLSLHNLGCGRWVTHVDMQGRYNIMRANDSVGYALDGFGEYDPAITIAPQDPTNPAGNVGIGTVNPQKKLHVVGGIKVTDGGVDPPFISFTSESHESIRQFAKNVSEDEKVMLFWNGDVRHLEVYVLSEDRFYTLTGELTEP